MLSPMDPDTVVDVAITVVAGYLVGSIPIANLVAARRGSLDLRDVGDRNPGYWNAKETLGRRAAIPVFVGDVAKGAVAAAVGLALADPGVWGLAYVGTGAAMVGHSFPLFAGFRGGRSVLTFVGGAVVYAPVPAVIAVGALLVTFLATRSFAVAARVGIVAFPIVQLVVEGPYRTAATGVLMTFIGIRFVAAAAAERRRPVPADPEPGDQA
jgi:glycerol-3-phosphate acyltransferase PlsY